MEIPEPDLAAVLAALRAEVEAAREAVTYHTKALDGHARWLEDHSSILGEYGRSFSQIDAWVARLEQTELAYRAQHEGAEHLELRRRLDELELGQSVRVFMEWIQYARVNDEPRGSLIIPTYNPLGYLPDALATIAAPHY